MTVPTNAIQTYDTTGIRESLDDIIYSVNREETPFVSAIKRGAAQQTTEEWLIDSLADADADNAAVEGDDITPGTYTPPSRVKNVTQIFTKSFTVTSTMNWVGGKKSLAGRASQKAYEEAKKGREMKRDIEKACLSSNASVLGNGSTARKLGGVGAWLETNTSHGGTAGAPGGYNSGTGVVDAPTNGANRTYTETIFLDTCQDIWEAGGSPTMVLAGGTLKRKMSTFAGIAALRNDVGAKGDVTVRGTVDIYQSDFGTYKVMADFFMPAEQVYIIDPMYWELAVGEGMNSEELAKTGLASKYMMKTELTLKSLNEKASGGIYDIVNAT